MLMDKSLFDYISENLCGDMKQTALDFANHLQDCRIEFIKDNGYWKEKIYYLCKFKDEYVCFIAIKDPDEPENHWQYGLRTVMPTKIQLLMIV